MGHKMNSKEKSNLVDSLFQRKWLILVVAFFGHACTAGLIYNLSVLYVEWLAAFGKTKAETAIIQSVCAGISTISGLFVGTLVSMFGPRLIGMISGTLSAVGFITSFFATSVVYLIATFGILTGLGTCGLYICSATAIEQYFEGKQRHLAFTFMSLGTGAGGIFYTYIQNYFSIKYGWKGCMLLVGGIVLNTVPLFAICKPMTLKKKEDDSTIKQVHEGNNNCQEHVIEETLFAKFKIVITNWKFLLNTVALCFVWCSICASLLIYVDFHEFEGFSRDDAVLLYLIMSIVSTVSRLLPGLLKQLPHVSIFSIMLVSATLEAIIHFLFPSAKSFTVNAILMACAGTGMGCSLGAVYHIAILSVVDTKYYSVALGITHTVAGVANAIALPITGYFRDTTGSYDVSFYVIGGSASFSAVIYLMVFCMIFCSGDSSKQQNSEQDESYVTIEDIKIGTDNPVFLS